jgi:hypothetical protein
VSKRKSALFPEAYGKPQPRRTLTYRKAELEQSGTKNAPLPARSVQLPGIPKGQLRIAFLPDVQAAPERPYDHLGWYGQYIAAKQPDVVVCIGDFADVFHVHHLRQLLPARRELPVAADERALARRLVPA